ncbi:MAG: DUF4238 domain-containing protein [Phycisphaerales bacterium]
MSTPRKHHYLPKSYLSAWTDDGTKDGQLQVIDKTNGRAWPGTPGKVARETDLYMIDIAEVEGDVAATEIEKTFHIIEDAAAPIIKRMLTGERMVSGEDRENIMSLLATLVVRVPSRLDWIDDFMRKPIEVMYRQLEAEGKFPQPSDPELAAQMKGWFDKGLITIEIKQNARLAMMASILPTLLNLFMLRQWTVLRTRSDAGDLICTDHPVLLEWIKRTPPGKSPGFGLQNTAVFVPIGPSAALLGLWDAEPKDETLTRDQVTFWNGKLLGYVDRFVFSRGDFAALHKSGTVHRRQDVIKCWVKS